MPPAFSLTEIGSRRAVHLFGAALICLGTLLAAFALWYVRGEARDAAERNVAGVAHILSEHAAGTVGSVEGLLLDVASHVASRSPGDLSRHLHHLIERQESVRWVAVFDAAGNLLVEAGGVPAGPFPADIAELDSDAGAGAEGFQIGVPVWGPGGRWFVTLSKGLRGPDGGFAGVAVAAVDPRYFADFYRSLDLGGGASVSLFRRDGVLLARAPGREDAIGRTFPLAETFRHLVPGKVEFVRRQSVVDGSPRIIGNAAVRGQPLVIAVTVTEDAALDGWYDQVAVTALVGTAASAVIWLLVVLVGRHVARQAELLAEVSRAHGETKSALAKAEEASRAKSRFLSMMGHELKTPLNAVIGFSEVLEAEVPGRFDPACRDYVRHIHASGQHLLDLVNDVLDLAALEGGRLELREEPVDLAAIVDSCSALTMPAAAEAGLRLETTIQAGLPRFLGDPSRLRRILLNLLSNAVKFTPPGGCVSIHADRVGGRVEIRVADNGIGMDPARIPEAVEPFAQLDSSLARRYQGAGLGLPIASFLARLHGTDLVIESAPGVGTTVRLRMPPDRLREPVRDLDTAA